MSTINPSLLVLLDLEDEHHQFDTLFHSRIYRRFTDKPSCLQHVQTRLTNVRLLHFFLPKSEHSLIPADLRVFNTIYYIYCANDVAMNDMNHQYPIPMFVKVFTVKFLLTYLRQAAISHLIEQAERCIHEPDEHDMALQGAIELSDELANELMCHMTEKIGVQPMNS